MPREIKTTIAVDGEQAFKRAINEANTSMRNLGTQLTLAQAQFKKDGDAMKLMESRSKTLTAEIGQQENIVKALEKAVVDSSKAYGENSEKTEKWEAELNRAKAKLVSLQSELTLNDQGLDRNGKAFDESSQAAADYQATLKTIGKNVSFETVTSGIHNITSVIEGAIKKVFSFAKAIRETFADAGEWADTLMTDSIKYRMDPEELQRWQYAAKIIDTDVDTIYNAQDRLSKKVKSGWKDGKIDMWEMLGIDLTDTAGKPREALDIMFDLGETLMSMTKIDGNDIRADAYAMEVFGKSWRDLLPLFTAGRAAWEAAKQDAEVVSNERVANLTALDDANQALANSWDVTKYSFLAELAPVVTDVTEAVTEMLQAFNEWMDTDEGKQAMNDLSDAIEELFSGLKDVKFKDAIDAVSGAINGIKEALTWLSEHKDDVYTALGIIAAGFALLEVSELALNIGKIATGFKTIYSFSGKKPPVLPGTDGTSGGSPTNTGTGTGTGTAAGGGWLAAKWAGFKATMAELLPMVTSEAAVVAAAITPALIQQDADIQKWREEQQERLKAAEEADLTGSENAKFIREAAKVTGLVLDEAENEKKNILGQSYTQMTDSHYDLLYGLQNRQGMEKAKLVMALMNSDFSNTAGNDTWQLLQRFWSGEALDPIVVEELLENVTDALIDQEKRGLPSMRPGEMPQEKEAAVETAAEEMTTAAETLRQIGEESKREAASGKVTSFLDLSPEEQANWVLASLGDVKNRGKLHSDIGIYGDENDNINGWKPWSMLLRYWGEYEDEWGRNQDIPLEASDLEGLVQYLRNLEIEKLQTEKETDLTGNAENIMNDAIAQMKVNVDSGKTVADKVAGMDIRKFNGLPAELQVAAQRGTAAGVSGIRVTLDGATVGRLVAPYVNAALGAMTV